MIRATVSPALPAGAETMKRIIRFGQSASDSGCAPAPVPVASATAKLKARRRTGVSSRHESLSARFLAAVRRASDLQQLPGVLAIDFALVLRRKPELLGQLDALRLERFERWRVGAEDEVVGADRFQRAARARNPIAGRFQVHHLQVVARLVGDGHWLVGAGEKDLVTERGGINQAADHLAKSPPRMGGEPP